MSSGFSNVPVRPLDREVLDAIRLDQRRGLADQFAWILDRYCDVEGYDRRTGRKVEVGKRRRRAACTA